jgi:hypothetical protein
MKMVTMARHAMFSDAGRCHPIVALAFAMIALIAEPTASLAKSKGGGKPPTCGQTLKACHGRCDRVFESKDRIDACKARCEGDFMGCKDPKPTRVLIDEGLFPSGPKHGIVQTPPVTDKPQGTSPGGGILSNPLIPATSGKPTPSGTLAPN